MNHPAGTSSRRLPRIVLQPGRVDSLPSAGGSRPRGEAPNRPEVAQRPEPPWDNAASGSFFARHPPMDPLPVLLQALHADPADEAAWLALADALEEQGQPARAQLARLQRSVRPMPEGEERRKAEDQIRGMVAAGVEPCMPGW